MSSTPKTPINKKQASSITPIVNKTPVSRTDISAQTQWNIGDRILCRYMNSEQQFYYEAKIIGIWNNGGSPHYSIHYQGWNSRYDEAVPHAEALRRFKRYTEEDAQKAKEELKKAKEDNNKPKRPKQQQDTPQQQKNNSGMVRNPKNVPELPLPDALRKILIEDERLINKNMYLPKLPARVTVFEIVHDYQNRIDPNRSPRSSQDDALSHSSAGFLADSAQRLLDYFEATIESMLLYKFERPMFNEFVLQIKQNSTGNGSNANNKVEKNEEPNFCFVKQFGLPYLLRMFVRFPEMLSYDEWTDRGLGAIIRHAKDFLIFLSKNHKDYFDIEKDYIVASPDYYKSFGDN